MDSSNLIWRIYTQKLNVGKRRGFNVAESTPQFPVSHNASRMFHVFAPSHDKTSAILSSKTPPLYLAIIWNGRKVLMLEAGGPARAARRRHQQPGPPATGPDRTGHSPPKFDHYIGTINKSKWRKRQYLWGSLRPGQHLLYCPIKNTFRQLRPYRRNGATVDGQPVTKELAPVDKTWSTRSLCLSFSESTSELIFCYPSILIAKIDRITNGFFFVILFTVTCGSTCVDNWLETRYQADH